MTAPGEVPAVATRETYADRVRRGRRTTPSGEQEPRHAPRSMRLSAARSRKRPSAFRKGGSGTGCWVGQPPDLAVAHLQDDLVREGASLLCA